MLDPRRRYRAEKLLEMVERRGALALEAFQEAIEENYPHLYVLISDWDNETEFGDIDDTYRKWVLVFEKRSVQKLKTQDSSLYAQLREKFLK